MSIGDRFLDGPQFEIINNMRAWTYAQAAELRWVTECEPCVAGQYILPDAPYTAPDTDLAPWYDPNNPDTAEFCGIMGLDCTGCDDSTRTATITQKLTGGGVIGPVYYQARSIVVRALAIGETACGLQAGLDWLDGQYSLTADPCLGDTLTFFDCCPCVCGNTDVLDLCWVRTYHELITGPVTCHPDWWPKTYKELRTGPPVASTTWCSWVVIYRHLRLGPPNWSCCAEQCITPYIRQFHQVRIVQGPTVIDKPQMSCGALAVLEFTIACADPHEHSLLVRASALNSTGSGGAPLPVPMEAMAMAAAVPSPFASSPSRRIAYAPSLEPDPFAVDTTAWLRESTTYVDPSPVSLSDDTAHVIRVAAIGEDTQAVRIGLYDEDGTFFTGYYLPSVPAGWVITIDEQRKRAYAIDENGVEAQLSAFVLYYDTVSPLRWANGTKGGQTMSVDRVEGDTTQLAVEILRASIGVA